MSTTATPDRFTTLPAEHALEATIVALEEHGFSVEVVDDLDAARVAVLARIPDGSSVMTSTSVTLAESGIADAINDGGGRWESARNKMFALDFATQAQEMKAIGGQPDYALGSVHPVSVDGTLVIASASGSQLASHARGAGNVIFVVGVQELVPTLAAARQRILAGLGAAAARRCDRDRSRAGAASRPSKSPPAGSNPAMSSCTSTAACTSWGRRPGRLDRSADPRQGHLRGLPARPRGPLPGRGRRPGRLPSPPAGRHSVRLARQRAFPEQLPIADLLRVATTTNNQE